MPDSVDPLHDYSISLLLPLTLKGFKTTDNSNQDDLHNHLRSLVLQCPNKLLDQSKTIRKTSSEPQNSKIQQIMLSEDEYTDIPAKVKDCPQGRRPALGRKRARFSLKPKTSQPSLPVDISLNIDQLQDPEEFYSAFEKHENAKKELQKQRGEVSVDSSQPKLSSTTGRRRPGMLGKTGGYKHRYALAERFESFVPSQETHELDSSSPLYDSSNKEATSQVFQTDSVASEGTNQTILDKLICTDLAGDGAVTLLHEYLQIKPINVEELSLPETESLCKIDFKALDHFTGPRKALSDIHNVVQGLNSEKRVDTHNQGKTSDYPLASPPPSKSPLSYLPMLKRRSIMQIDPPTNPFSFRGIELSPTKQHSYVKVVEESGPSPDLHASHDDAVNYTPTTLSDKPELGCEGPTMDNLQDYMDPMPNESHIALQDKDEDMQQETMTLSGEPELGSERLTMDNLQGGNALSENSDPAVGENHTQYDHPKIISSEENNESLPEPPTNSSSVESEQNAPSGGSKKRRELVHRKSLAGAGTTCDSSVRKSTRIKSRPLEYWKGERLLYASHDDAVECTRVEADGNGLTSSGKFQFMRISGDNTGSSNGLGKMVTEDFTCPLESIDVNSSDLNIDMDPMANESHGALQDKNEGLQHETMTLSDKPELGCEGPIMDNVQDYMYPTPNESHTALQDKDEDMQQETMTLSSEPELGYERFTMDNLQENSDLAVGDNHTEDDHPNIISSEENNESLPEPPTILSNVESKQKAPAGASRKRRELVYRKSLAGAGTAWDSGVRKSTRIKSRPLEYWKGERFLYGRVHESLLTVIGLKYESPEKESGKPMKKVKYFVSDVHKALVDLQARH